MDVVKIGGSVLFDNAGKFNQNVVDIFLRYLQGENLVVVIGCGRFLHHQVLEYALTDEPVQGNFSNCNIEAGYQNISEIIDGRLAKLSAELGMPYSSAYNLFMKESDGRKDRNGIVAFNAEHLTIPMLTGGGMVADITKRYSAISSDTVAAFFAEFLRADRLIIFTDVDGVWSDARTKTLLKRVSVQEMNKMEVTGGMADKIRRVTNSLTKECCDIIIASGYKERVIADVMNGIYNECTQILL